MAEAGAGRYRNRSTPLEPVSERGDGHLETRKKSTSDCVCFTCAADGMDTVRGGGGGHSTKLTQGKGIREGFLEEVTSDPRTGQGT